MKRGKVFEVFRASAEEVYMMAGMRYNPEHIDATAELMAEQFRALYPDKAALLERHYDKARG